MDEHQKIERDERSRKAAAFAKAQTLNRLARDSEFQELLDEAAVEIQGAIDRLAKIHLRIRMAAGTKDSSENFS